MPNARVGIGKTRFVHRIKRNRKTNEAEPALTSIPLTCDCMICRKMWETLFVLKTFKNVFFWEPKSHTKREIFHESPLALLPSFV